MRSKLSKDETVSNKLYWVINHYYDILPEELDNWTSVEIGLKSIHQYKPMDLRLMREIFETGKLNSKHFVNL